MKTALSHWIVVLFSALALVLGAHNARAAGDEDYRPGPDSQRQPGVPSGKIFRFDFDSSKIFPGTTRKIDVYVPAQYKADKPACVYVGLDALGFAAPIVFDNLIHKKEIPLLIAVGVSPGQVPSADPPANRRIRFSRRFSSPAKAGSRSTSALGRPMRSPRIRTARSSSGTRPMGRSSGLPRTAT